jgi:hypothetical protein
MLKVFSRSKETKERIEDHLIEVEMAMQPLLDGFMTRVEDGKCHLH